ncbi:MAG: FtsW/RodA/SpoVE family cell cycle protein [Fimbriimonas sp.]
MTKLFKFPDPLLILLALFATLLGLIFIYDASFVLALAKNTDDIISPPLRQQLQYLPVALIFGFFCSAIPGKLWFQTSKLAIWVGLVLLILVKFIGKEVNGATRWIPIGSNTFQPSEFAKLATVIFLAGVFASRAEWVEQKLLGRSWRWIAAHRVIPKAVRCAPMLLVLFAVWLIENEPDLGTAAVLASIAFLMSIAGGANRWTLIGGCFVSVLAVFIMVKSEPYRLDRINNHNHRYTKQNVDSAGYQTVMSEVGMAMGGLKGTGPGSGRAKGVMPEAETDFLITTPAEELGLGGALFIIATLCAIIWRLCYQSFHAQTMFVKLGLLGMASWIAVQSGTNVLMANGTLPAIGIPLPFLSAGASSLTALWMGIGLSQSLLRMEEKPKEEKQGESGDHGRGNGRPYLSRA